MIQRMRIIHSSVVKTEVGDSFVAFTEIFECKEMRGTTVAMVN